MWYFPTAIEECWTEFKSGKRQQVEALLQRQRQVQPPVIEPHSYGDVPLVSVVRVDYTKLRDWLAAKKWREADYETDERMLEEAISRLIEGILSGIGIGFIFYLYPVVRHTFSDKYRYKFRFEDDGKLRFRNETIKYLKIGFFYGFTYGFIMGTIIGPFGSQNGI